MLKPRRLCCDPKITDKLIFHALNNNHYGEYSKPFYNGVVSFKLELGCQSFL